MEWYWVPRFQDSAMLLPGDLAPKLKELFHNIHPGEGNGKMWRTVGQENESKSLYVFHSPLLWSSYHL